MEADEPFAEFVAAGVSRGAVVDGRGGVGDVAEPPHEDVEAVGAEVAEATDAGLLGVGHPAPFGVEPSAERTGVAVGKACARDLAEGAVIDAVLEEEMVGHAAHEVAGLESDVGFFDGVGDGVGVFGAHAQRFFGVEEFLRGGGGDHELFVAVGFGADDDAVDGGVCVNFGEVVDDGGL